MKYKHIQAAHELRMWIIMLASAAGTAIAIADRHPEWVEAVKNKLPNKRKRIKMIVVEEKGEG